MGFYCEIEKKKLCPEGNLKFCSTCKFVHLKDSQLKKKELRKIMIETIEQNNQNCLSESDFI